ncbi:MAG: phospholipase D-like domain-containing protein [Prevotellaceae bacterium]|jgi:hypothetical protein|nr:phospholipase D-like domain-containing protein [Prevotellaceae bacterium]
MHNKFCVIDEEIVISGSYNWTNKAKQNHESITIIRDKELACQFLKEFKNMQVQYFGKESKTIILDYTQLCIRLETLKNGILLEDEDDINFQLRKLIPVSTLHSGNPVLEEIIENTKRKQYSQTIALIENFVSKHRSLAVYIDPDIVAIQLEIKALGIQISSLEDEKAEIEKVLYAFNLRHNQELGRLILQILQLRKERLQEEAKHDASKTKEAEEAESDYEGFNQSYEKSKKQHINTLDENQQAELKQKFRKASKLCHPDVVNEAQSKLAHELFQNLKKAYDDNDLSAVTKILSDLENGIFTTKTASVGEKQKLNTIVIQLRINRDKLEEELITLKKSEVYQTILTIEDWNLYFTDMKEKLQKELDELQKEVMF